MLTKNVKNTETIEKNIKIEDGEDFESDYKLNKFCLDILAYGSLGYLAGVPIGSFFAP